MSQRECAGFNAPRFSVEAGDEVGSGPEASLASCIRDLFRSPCPERSVAVGVAHPLNVATAAKSGPRFRITSLIPPSVERTPLSASVAVGVGHPANKLTVLRLLSVLPASL